MFEASKKFMNMWSQNFLILATKVLDLWFKVWEQLKVGMCKVNYIFIFLCLMGSHMYKVLYILLEKFLT